MVYDANTLLPSFGTAISNFSDEYYRTITGVLAIAILSSDEVIAVLDVSSSYI